MSVTYWIIAGVTLNLGLLIANLIVLGYSVKLYTEFFKERVKGKS